MLYLTLNVGFNKISTVQDQEETDTKFAYPRTSDYREWEFFYFQIDNFVD